MSAAGLKAAIISALGTAEDSAKQEAFAQAMATAIVDYIKANAVVSVTMPGNGLDTGGFTLVNATGTGTVA